MKTLIRTAAKAAVDALTGQRASTAVAGELAEARERLASARAARAAAQAAREAALDRDDDNARRAARAAIVDAEDAIEAASRRVDRLETEEHAAIAAEAEGERCQRLEEARAKLERAERLIRKSYPEAAGAIVRILKEIAEADLLVANVNANLPAGAQPLRTLEQRLLRAHLPREELEVEEIDVWVGAVDGAQVPHERVAEIRDLGDGTGHLPPRDGRDGAKPVRKRRARRATYLPAVSSHAYEGFASRISLPGLAYEAPYWEPAHDDHPLHVLQNLERLEAYGHDHRSPRRPQVETVLLPPEA